MKIKNLPLLILATSLIVSKSLFGQITVHKINEIDKIKEKTTYVMVDNPENPIVKEYADIFKKYWTLTNIEFIRPKDIGKYIQPYNTFWSIRRISYSSSSGSSRDATHFIFWRGKDKFFEKGNTTFTYYDTEVLASFLLQPGRETDEIHDIFTDYNKDLIRNWTPNIFKNKLQYINRKINQSETVGQKERIAKEDELKNLKTDTIFIVKTAFINHNSYIRGDVLKESKVLKKYTYNYKVVTISELEERLKKNIQTYYLIHTRSDVARYIVVVNSDNGEVIYSKSAKSVFNFSPGEATRLYKTINKCSS